MMSERFEWMEHRYEELTVESAQPEVIADLPRWQKILKEQAQLEPAVMAWRDYRRLSEELDAAQELLHLEDMAEMAQEELDVLRPRQEEMERELRLLLLPKDPNDDRNVILEVRAGAGGDEAGLFGAMLLRMYTRYAERHGFQVRATDISGTEIGGIREAVIMLSGQGAYSKLKFESGVHRVQRVPVTESSGRIHTSTATVAVLPEADEVDVQISQDDLRIDTYRAGSAGGQHVNKTDSAVRITHLPTGIVVSCQNERSQLANRRSAMGVLRARLFELERRKRREELAALRGEHARIDFGSQIRSYVMQPYTMVKDHRTGAETGNVLQVLDGEIDEFIKTYLQSQVGESGELDEEN